MRGGFRGCASGLRRAAKNGREEIREVVRALKKRRQGEPAANHGQDRQDPERPEHAPRRLVHVHFLFVVARLPVEREEDQPKHVERREQRGEQTKSVENAAGRFVLE